MINQTPIKSVGPLYGTDSSEYYRQIVPKLDELIFRFNQLLFDVRQMEANSMTVNGRFPTLCIQVEEVADGLGAVTEAFEAIRNEYPA